MLRLVLDTIPQRVFWKDTHAVFVGCNAAFARDAGLAEPAEIVGKTDYDLPWRELAEEYAVDDKAVLSTGRPKLGYDEGQVRADGGQSWVHVSKVPLLDGDDRVVGILGTYEDITDRKQAERALRESEQLLADILENIPTMVFVKDARDLRFVRVNRAAEWTMGYSRDELIGVDDQLLVPPEETVFFASVDRYVVETGETVDVPEETLTVPHHGRRILRTRKVPILDEEGQPKYLLGISEDITDLKAAEEGRDRLQEVLRERMRLFTALAEFAAAVNAIREPERMVATLGDAVSSILPTDTAVITMLDRSDGRYRVRSARGLGPGAVGVIIQPGAGTAGRAITERTVIVREHKPGDQYSAALRDYQLRDTSWALGVPLINEDSVLGVISVGRFDTDAIFTQPEIEVFALLGSHAALALANAYLTEEVSALAIHDGLTDLYNRRHFDAALDLALARFKRRGPTANLAAIMFDLDRFGNFNRRHGHLAGDAVLRLFGEILRERLRAADIVARYGGDEFVAILDDCGLPEAVRMADEVRREFEARTVPGAAGQPLRATLSAGCAVLDPAIPTKEALLGRADAGLFMAKRAGRNRVVAA
jgi:diguanylate cyclase (GGDEF)-like protein/PAS domain S-box-containing protein